MRAIDQRTGNAASYRDGLSSTGQPGSHRDRGTVLAAIPEAPGTCRYLTRAALRVHDLDDLVGDAEIIVSEFASNAVLATRADEAAGLLGGEPPVIVLVLAWPARGIRIEMWDRASGLPQMREPDWTAEGGRGLFVIDQLTGGRWGCLKAGAAKCVWAELANPR
jgi:anti-sigma regulatory factor (Ser/Thr protein kinase)